MHTSKAKQSIRYVAHLTRCLMCRIDFMFVAIAAPLLFTTIVDALFTQIATEPYCICGKENIIESIDEDFS